MLYIPQNKHKFNRHVYRWAQLVSSVINERTDIKILSLWNCFYETKNRLICSSSSFFFWFTSSVVCCFTLIRADRNIGGLPNCKFWVQISINTFVYVAYTEIYFWHIHQGRLIYRNRSNITLQRNISTFVSVHTRFGGEAVARCFVRSIRSAYDRSCSDLRSMRTRRRRIASFSWNADCVRQERDMKVTSRINWGQRLV